MSYRCSFCEVPALTKQDEGKIVIQNNYRSAFMCQDCVAESVAIIARSQHAEPAEIEPEDAA